MNSTDLLELWRFDVGDTERPYLWSDEEAFAYMNNAYFQFVRLTGGIPDFRSEACEVPIVEGEPVAELHPSILRIMSAKRRSDDYQIDILNAADLGRLSAADYGHMKPLLMSTARGPVTTLVIGMQRNVGRWINVPDADDLAYLHIYRLPLTDITGEGQSLDEIEGVHHLHLLEGMKARAYLKQDAETFDRTAAQENEALFRTYCDQVRAENERYKHKTRVVQYGGL